MTTTAPDSPARQPRPKSFRFSTGLDWLEGRSAMVRGGEGKLEFRVAPPPEFRGEPNVWSPEHLFVATIDTCLLLTFAGLAEKLGLQMVSYRSEAEGLLEFVEGSFRFTAVTLRPEIIVRDESSVTLAGEILERAHAACLVTNSVRAVVTVEPDIRTRA